MAPGPKKNSRRSTNEQRAGNRKQNLPVQNEELEQKVIETQESDDTECGDPRYRKREITSNADRYNEPVIDVHADTKLGEDYEVLLSYSGGAGSQHLLVEEKEWEENTSELMNFTLDFNYLNASLKCIPFYKRLKIAEDTFEPGQINKMINAAEKNKLAYSKITPNKYSSEKTISNSVTSPYNENSIVQIEKSDFDDLNKPVKSPISVVPAGIEKTIESLASTLAMKTSLHGDRNSDSKTETFDKTVAKDNDLDFLLSLSVGNSASVKKEESAKPKITNANVDDWLNSILEN